MIKYVKFLLFFLTPYGVFAWMLQSELLLFKQGLGSIPCWRGFKPRQRLEDRRYSSENRVNPIKD